MRRIDNFLRLIIRILDLYVLSFALIGTSIFCVQIVSDVSYIYISNVIIVIFDYMFLVRVGSWARGV